MREIKFRAWDKHKKTWITEPVGFTMSVVDGKFHIFGFDGAFADMYQEKIDLQQYTGLHDKNGVEIYEGDIVNLDDGTRNPYQVVWDDSFSGWAFGKSNGVNSLFSLYGAGVFEVIGNIYETPELLK